MNYAIFWRGDLVIEVPPEELSEILSTFECWIDHKSRTVML